VLEQVLAALAHAHGRQVLHRDLKPTNVLLIGEHRVKVADFGLAMRKGRMTSLGYTPRYAAPEQVLGEVDTHGPWTDLYAVGCLAWWLATGRAPYHDVPLRSLREAVCFGDPGILAGAVDVPGELEAWIRTLMGRTPAERPASAAAALQTLPGPASALPLGEGTAEPAWTGAGVFRFRQPPLVGRQEELDALMSRLTDVIQRREQSLVVLRGVSGVGKSRLAEAVAELAHERHGAYAHVMRHGGSGDAAFAMAALEDDLRNRRATMEPERGDSERLDLVRGLLTNDVPSVLVVDDGQWSIDGLLLAGRLLDAPPGPVLVLVTVQEEELVRRPLEAEVLAGLQAHPAATSWLVGALPQEVQGDLVDSMLALSDLVRQRVVERASGNPGFALHMLGHLVDHGRLRPSPEGYVLESQTELVLPSALTDLWRARVEELLKGQPPQVAQVIELAATFGGHVALNTLRAAAGSSRDVELAARALEERALGSFDARELRLAHGMLRAAILLRSTEAGRQRGHHLLAAETLSMHPGPGVAERRGRHLLAAGCANEAVLSLFEALQEASDSNDPRCSIDLLATTRSAMERADVQPSDARYAELAYRQASQAREYAGLDVARRLAKEALQRKPAFHERDLARFHLLLGLIVATEDSAHGLDEWRREVDCALQQGGRYPIIRGIADMHLSSIAAMSGDDETCERVLRRGLQTCEEEGFEELEAALWLEWIQLRIRRGDYDEPERVLDRTRGQQGDHGDVRRELARGDVEVGRGRLPLARRHYDTALEMVRFYPTTESHCEAQVGLAIVDVLDRDFDGARARLQGLEQRTEIGEIRTRAATVRAAIAAHDRDELAFRRGIDSGAGALLRGVMLSPGLVRVVEVALSEASEAGLAHTRDAQRLLDELNTRVVGVIR